MRILMVTPTPPAEQAASSISVLFYAQLTGLSKRHTVDVVTVAGPDPSEPEAVESLRSAGFRVEAAIRSDSPGPPRWKRRWQLVAPWLSSRTPFRTIWFWEQDVQRSINRLVAERAYDLITVEDNAMGRYQFPAGIPTVFTEYEVRRPRRVDWAPSVRSNPLRWALAENDWSRWRHYQPSVWRRYDRLRVLTERDKETMLSLAPDLADRVRVTPFGVSVPPQVHPEREEARTLVFPAGFTHPPNVDAAHWLADEIMPLIRTACPGVTLMLVGSFPPPSVQALACDDILVTGWVPAIEPYLDRAAIVVAPVRTGGGMRVKVVQAMAHGRAVVTTPRGAEGLYSTGQAPPLIAAATASDIAGAIAHLLESDQKRHDLGRAAHTFVRENYSTEAYVRRLESVYEEVVPQATGS